MEQTKICVEMIRYGSTQYDQAAQLRYALFYREHGISYESIFDHDEHQQIHVAVINKNDDDVMAYGRLGQNNPLEFQIYQMVVKTDFQGHGFGSAILNALIQLAIEKGASRIVLNARTTKTGFYEKWGFITTGEVFVSPLTGIPHIKMQKVISDNAEP